VKRHRDITQRRRERYRVILRKSARQFGPEDRNQRSARDALTLRETRAVQGAAWNYGGSLRLQRRHEGHKGQQPTETFHNPSLPLIVNSEFLPPPNSAANLVS